MEGERKASEQKGGEGRGECVKIARCGATDRGGKG